MTHDPLPTPHAPDLERDDRRWRLAVLGLGRRGLEYAAAVARDTACQLAGLADTRTDLRSFARGCGFTAPLAVSLPRLLERGSLDGVIVCAPAVDVPGLVVRAIDSGLAVLVPDAPAADLAGAAQLEEVLARSARPAVSGIAVLTHPLFTRAGALLAGGTLGAVRTVSASVQVSRVFGPSALPPVGDVLDHVAFDLVVLLDHLFGPAVAATARGQRLYGTQLDEAHLTLQLAAGADVRFDCSWSVPGYPRTAMVLEIECEHGRVLASDDALEVDLDGVEEPQRMVLAGLEEGHALEWGEAHSTLQAFTQRLTRGMRATDPLVLMRAVRAGRVLAAARESIAAGGTRIEVHS